MILNKNVIAYICHTCGSPISVCADCFKNSNHEGHDYIMFTYGGVCGKYSNYDHSK